MVMWKMKHVIGSLDHLHIKIQTPKPFWQHNLQLTNYWTHCCCCWDYLGPLAPIFCQRTWSSLVQSFFVFPAYENTSDWEFPDVCRYYFGKFGQWLSLIFSMVSLVGAMVVYWVLMSNFLYNTGQFIYSKLQCSHQYQERGSVFCTVWFTVWLVRDASWSMC